MGRAKTFSLLSLLLAPRISLKRSSSFTLFLSASLALASILSFYFCLAPPKVVYGQYLFLVSSYILPYLLAYSIPSYFSSPLCYCLPYNPISYGWQPLCFAGGEGALMSRIFSCRGRCPYEGSVGGASGYISDGGFIRSWVRQRRGKNQSVFV